MSPRGGDLAGIEISGDRPQERPDHQEILEGRLEERRRGRTRGGLSYHPPCGLSGRSSPPLRGGHTLGGGLPGGAGPHVERAQRGGWQWPNALALLRRQDVESGFEWGLTLASSRKITYCRMLGGSFSSCGYQRGRCLPCARGSAFRSRACPWISMLSRETAPSGWVTKGQE